jgi:hypothetical protein
MQKAINGKGYWKNEQLIPGKQAMIDIACLFELAIFE